VLLTKHYSCDQIRKNEVGGACSRYGERRGAYRVLVGKLEGKRPLGRLGHKWEYSIKMDLHEIGWGNGLNLSGSG